MAPRRSLALTAAALALVVTGPTALAGPVVAAPATPTTSPTPARTPLGPVHRDLPVGFQPEGIAVDLAGTHAFLGSRADGDIVRMNLVTGAVGLFAEGPGTPSLGMKVDLADRLWVAGGTGGDVRVLDATTGTLLRSYQLVPPGTAAFINDVVVTDDTVWVTDSASARLFALPLGSRYGLPTADRVRQVPLTGSWTQGATTSANGIVETPDQRALLVVNSSNGALYRVNPRTGRCVLVDLGGVVLTNGDGLLREGRVLYAVQNRLDRIAVLRLSRDGRSGQQRDTLSTPDFDVPTTAARSGGRLFLPNARFTTPPTPTTSYWVTGIGAPQSRSARRG